MAHGDGIDWVESGDGLKWLGYVRGLGNLLPHIMIIKEPWPLDEPGGVRGYLRTWGHALGIEEKEQRGGWVVIFGEHIASRRFATTFAAQKAAVELALEHVTEALVNLKKEKE